MALYEKMFGRILRNEADGDEGAGGPADRGDELVADTPESTKAEDSDDESDESDDSEEGGGEGDKDAEGQDRDEKGRFAKKDEQAIPKARFDQAVAKERERAAALARENEELKAAVAQIKKQEDTSKLDAEINELEKQRAQFLLEGNAEKAAELGSQIRTKERHLAIEESRSMSAQAKEQAREEIRTEMALERLEEEYPELSPDSEHFDEDLVELILAKQRTLMTRDKLVGSKALIRAATEVMRRFGAQQPSEKKGLGATQPDRKQAQVRKNIETSKKQPPSMKDAGMDTDKAGSRAEDIARMEYEEFSKLPEAEKAKLRGDFL